MSIETTDRRAPSTDGPAPRARPSAGAPKPRSSRPKGGLPASEAAGEALLRRFQIACKDLKIGMFVAELDRSWLDTPFLIQGFAIDSASEIQALTRHCRYVYVDLDLSDPSVVDDIRAAEMKRLPIEEERGRSASFRTVPGAGGDTPRSDRKIGTGGRTRFRNFLQIMHPGAAGLGATATGLARLRHWFDGLFGRRIDPTRLAAEAKARRAELRRLLPEGTVLRRYKDRSTVDQELPRAREAFSRTEQTLKQLVADVRSGRPPSLSNANDVVDDIVQSMVDNPDAMMWVARMRDEDSGVYGHAVKVAIYLVALGRHLGFSKPELTRLGMMGLLADVGKTKLPRAILEKPGMLTPQEYTLVKEHVRLGLEALQLEGPLPDEIVQGIAQHHERLDGSGYPRGLKGDEIGIFGRMAAIADTFTALVTPRVYANPLTPHDALLNLFEWAGTSFHEPLVEQFVQAVGVFPVGSMVELSTGEVGIVLAHNKVRRLEPRVLLLTWPDKNPMATPVERDLFERPKGSDGKPIRIVRALPAGAYGLKVDDYYASEMGQANGLL